MKKIIKVIIAIILLLLLIVNLTLIIKSRINKDEIASFLGYTPFIVTTDSMSPDLIIGDLIITKKVSDNEIKTGDIIAFFERERNIVVTHRIVKIQKNVNSKSVYILKGDNSDNENLKSIEFENIQGKYIFKIPYIGKLKQLISSPRNSSITNPCSNYYICVFRCS